MGRIIPLFQSSSGSAIIAAPPPPGGGGGAVWRGNEPVGMTFETERAFSNVHEGDWGDLIPDGGTIENDPTAPFSPPNVGSFNYPQDFSSAGISPDTTSVSITASRRVYLCFWFKYSANWYGHETGISKLGYVWDNGDPIFVYEAEVYADGPIDTRIGLQLPVHNVTVDGWYQQNLVPSARVTRNQWCLMEILLTGNHAATEDGGIDWWLDGVHVASWTGIQYTTGTSAWDLVRIAPVWGGAGGPNVPAAQYLRFDHFYVSRGS